MYGIFYGSIVAKGQGKAGYLLVVAVQRYGASPLVEFAEPNYKMALPQPVNGAENTAANTAANATTNTNTNC